jgi:hypothetical protein
MRTCIAGFGFMLWLVASSAQAVGTAFTYQGTLEDNGALATGSYDLQFRVLDAANAAVGTTVVVDNVAVSQGVFTVALDFGSNAFTGPDRFLEIGVRPGASSGAYTILAPNTPVLGVPYAQTANVASVADAALTVADGAIVEADFVSAAVSSRAIANGAVGSSEIAAGAVTSSEIASLAVDTVHLADGAVTNAKIESGSILPSRLAGVLGTYGIAVAAAANSCTTYSVPFGGDVQANDIPYLSLDSGSVLPSNLSLQAIRVTADNTVEIRACNSGSTSQSSGAIVVRLITFR